MANKVVERGRQQIGRRASNLAANAIQVGVVDDRAVAFDDEDLNLGSPANMFKVALDQVAEIVESGDFVGVRHRIFVGTGDFNGQTIRRISIHNDVIGNVLLNSDTLIAGIDGKTIAKDSGFSLALFVDLRYSDESV